MLRTLTGLRARGVWIEVSTPLTPGLCDDEASLVGIARFVAAELGSTPWHLLRSFPSRTMAGATPTAVARLAEAVRIGRQHGLHHVYCPALSALHGLYTRCADCGAVAIVRSASGSVLNRLRGERCRRCGSALAGLALEATVDSDTEGGRTPLTKTPWYRLTSLEARPVGRPG